MLNKITVIKFYDTLRRYKDHEKTVELLVNHFYFKVSDRLTVKQFNHKVEQIIAGHLKGE